MTIYDGGWPEQPEDETEQKWQDPDDGDLPWEPERTGKPGERWEPQTWPEEDAGPEYRFYKKRLEEGEDK